MMDSKAKKAKAIRINELHIRDFPVPTKSEAETLAHSRAMREKKFRVSAELPVPKTGAKIIPHKEAAAKTIEYLRERGIILE